MKSGVIFFCFIAIGYLALQSFAAPLADKYEDDVSEFVLIYDDLSGFLRKRIILPENLINSTWVSDIDDENITYRESRVNELIKFIDDLVAGSLYATAKMIEPKN